MRRWLEWLAEAGWFDWLQGAEPPMDDPSAARRARQRLSDIGSDHGSPRAPAGRSTGSRLTPRSKVDRTAVPLPPKATAYKLPQAPRQAPKPSWSAALPAKILAIGVSRTDPDASGRLVAFAGILLDSASLAAERFDLSFVHFIFNPGKPSRADALAEHGYADDLLVRQDPFSRHRKSIRGLLAQADLVVAHGADSALGLLNRELRQAGETEQRKPIFCTIRQSGMGAAATDLAVATHAVGIEIDPPPYTALHRGWGALMIYLRLVGCPHHLGFDAFGAAVPANLKAPVPG